MQHTSLTTVIDERGIRRFNYFGEKRQTDDVLNDMFDVAGLESSNITIDDSSFDSRSNLVAIASVC